MPYKDPAAKRAQNREWTRNHRRSNPELYKQKRSEYYHSGKGREYQRAYHLKRKYGIDYATYRERLLSGPCEICGTTTPDGTGIFHVDHNHATGQFRGILCFKHNTMIGKANDTPRILRAAADYLEKANNEETIATLADLASAYRGVLTRNA